MVIVPMVSCKGNMKNAETDHVIPHSDESKMKTGMKDRSAPVMPIRKLGVMSIICSRML